MDGWIAPGKDDLVQVEVLIPGPRQESDLRSLHGWLRREPALRGTAVSLDGEAPAPGSMGQLVDVVQLVTGNGWSAASFVLSVLAWRQTRPRPPRIVIRRGDVEVSLAEGTEEEVRRITTALLEQPGDANGSSS
ncbi:hypothetical protein ACFWIJ_00290 [Streptomyces sp. NPDC127079]|uniref:effector-associated constant component EACC1 n=1 Tax=Streptomyces TaxID=1883 RepID=UPI001E5EFD5B|nr:hypothetical protein [Streptomyces lincolnensis]MCD7444778.1 hypothetical protein [Streptomyces lincolnensis]